MNILASTGPDVKYADRNDMERIFSGMVKNSVFSWGPYKDGGPWDSPTCRQVNRPRQYKFRRALTLPDPCLYNMTSIQQGKLSLVRFLDGRRVFLTDIRQSDIIINNIFCDAGRS